MSYSITIRAKSKYRAIEAAKAALAQQLGQMPEHARDAQAAHASISGHIAALDEPKEGNEIVVEAFGSLSGSWSGGTYETVTSSNHNVRAYHAPASA